MVLFRVKWTIKLRVWLPYVDKSFPVNSFTVNIGFFYRDQLVISYKRNKITFAVTKDVKLCIFVRYICLIQIKTAEDELHGSKTDR